MLQATNPKLRPSTPPFEVDLFEREPYGVLPGPLGRIVEVEERAEHDRVSVFDRIAEQIGGKAVGAARMAYRRGA
jgi:hypothetical protein